ncbi:TPA: hypothetical protein QHR93_004189 [Citrobacter freundii]|uniref:hypothetical protein n=1 Tax=Enterobacter cloacae TaxID=550 RepID=UPI00277E9026|nr:hypothetical protein [Citrobacter freundii]
MSIYNDFVRTRFPDLDQGELQRLSSRAECAADGILTGVAAVGKMMCFSVSDGYEPSEKDFQDIGGMLMELMPLVRALSDTAGNADFCRHRLDKDK